MFKFQAIEKSSDVYEGRGNPPDLGRFRMTQSGNKGAETKGGYSRAFIVVDPKSVETTEHEDGSVSHQLKRTGENGRVHPDDFVGYGSGYTKQQHLKQANNANQEINDFTGEGLGQAEEEIPEFLDHFEKESHKIQDQLNEQNPETGRSLREAMEQAPQKGQYLRFDEVEKFKDLSQQAQSLRDSVESTSDAKQKGQKVSAPIIVSPSPPTRKEAPPQSAPPPQQGGAEPARPNQPKSFPPNKVPEAPSKPSQSQPIKGRSNGYGGTRRHEFRNVDNIRRHQDWDKYVEGNTANPMMSREQFAERQNAPKAETVPEPGLSPSQKKKSDPYAAHARGKAWGNILASDETGSQMGSQTTNEISGAMQRRAALKDADEKHAENYHKQLKRWSDREDEREKGEQRAYGNYQNQYAAKERPHFERYLDQKSDTKKSIGESAMHGGIFHLGGNAARYGDLKNYAMAFRGTPSYADALELAADYHDVEAEKDSLPFPSWNDITGESEDAHKEKREKLSQKKRDIQSKWKKLESKELRRMAQEVRDAATSLEKSCACAPEVGYDHLRQVPMNLLPNPSSSTRPRMNHHQEGHPFGGRKDILGDLKSAELSIVIALGKPAKKSKKTKKKSK